jgi:hypothetical protein
MLIDKDGYPIFPSADATDRYARAGQGKLRASRADALLQKAPG